MKKLRKPNNNNTSCYGSGENVFDVIAEAIAAGELPRGSTLWGDADDPYVAEGLRAVATISDARGEYVVVADDPAWEGRYQAALAKVRAREVGE